MSENTHKHMRLTFTRFDFSFFIRFAVVVQPNGRIDTYVRTQKILRWISSKSNDNNGEIDIYKCDSFIWVDWEILFVLLNSTP